MTKEFLEEARLVDLDNEQIKEALGHTYHALKNLADSKKDDPDLKQMREQIKHYLEDNYGSEEKRFKARMKALRTLADAKGIRWKAPEDI